MRDRLGREIHYLRISVTDRCNLRCSYCLPDGSGIDKHPDRLLSREDLVRIVSCAAALGIRHVRLTGGEPLVRADCPDLVAGIKTVPGIETVALTTNGTLLRRNLGRLLEAGLDGVNISLDTTDPDRFRRITWGGKSSGPEVFEVISAIREASAADLRVKINVVTLPDTDPEEMIAFARDLPVDVRFIETMPIGFGRGCPGLGNRKILEEIRRNHSDLERECGQGRLFFSDRDSDKKITGRAGGESKETDRVLGRKADGWLPHGQGPAVYYRIPGFRGSIGFISAMSHKFCTTCNRVRLTADGFLKTCLCFDQGADLRPYLTGGCSGQQGGDPNGQRVGDSPDRWPADQADPLKEAMRQAILAKPKEHCFDRPWEITEKHPMSQIGG